MSMKTFKSRLKGVFKSWNKASCRVVGEQLLLELHFRDIHLSGGRGDPEFRFKATYGSYGVFAVHVMLLSIKFGDQEL